MLLYLIMEYLHCAIEENMTTMAHLGFELSNKESPRIDCIGDVSEHPNKMLGIYLNMYLLHPW